MRDIDEITGVIVDCAFKIHKDLGPGLLESVYQVILAEKLKQQGLSIETEKQISFEYEGIEINNGFRVDLLVENNVVVELKSVETMSAVYPKQLLTYLRLLNLPVGLLINFSAPTLKQGLQRIVNGYVDKKQS